MKQRFYILLTDDEGKPLLLGMPPGRSESLGDVNDITKQNCVPLAVICCPSLCRKSDYDGTDFVARLPGLELMMARLEGG